MNYKIIDNFLPQNEFQNIQEIMLGSNIQWYYNSFKVKTDDHDTKNDPYNFQFTHTFYKNYRPTSDFIELFDPILKILNPSALIRIKANLQPRTEKITKSQHHLDHDHFDGKIAIFYINTNNGYTIFEDDTKINSVENRLLIFDGNILHAGTSCTDQKMRCVINFMFYTWTDFLL
jgi:hypothetical protein